MKNKLRHLTLALALLTTAFCMSACDDETPDGPYNTPDSSVGGTVPTVEEAIDLGLTSGTLWAPYNVGATAPGEAGAYIAWGETGAKSAYDWGSYKWSDKKGANFSKYTPDGKTILDSGDDAAAVNWGGSWVMPTVAQLEELFSECTQEWKAEGEYAEGSLAGYLLTSKENGKTLFLPAAGRKVESSLYHKGEYGGYWSSNLLSGGAYYASNYYFQDPEPVKSFYLYRYIGLSVRPVCQSSK